MPATVCVSGSDNEHDITIAIHNRGIGIAPDKVSQIFNPMVRIAANSHAGASDVERTSLGIGLFISREIILAHGGQISVTSNDNDGTTFTVTLPRRPA